MTNRPDTYYPAVLTDETDQIVACATLVIEHKFIHACGRVGHIEDVVVDARQRGKQLGRILVEALRVVAVDGDGGGFGCYKVILDCAEDNVSFYEKCEYRKKGVQMAYYRP